MLFRGKTRLKYIEKCVPERLHLFRRGPDVFELF